MSNRRTAVVLIVSLAIAFLAGTADAAIPRLQNCGQLNAVYPHGVGRVGARDKTTGKPVTNFTRDTHFYLRAMHFNRGLDRDHDGIACERH